MGSHSQFGHGLELLNSQNNLSEIVAFRIGDF